MIESTLLQLGIGGGTIFAMIILGRMMLNNMNEISKRNAEISDKASLYIQENTKVLQKLNDKVESACKKMRTK